MIDANIMGLKADASTLKQNIGIVGCFLPIMFL